MARKPFMYLEPLVRCGLRGLQARGHSPAFRRGTYTAATDGEAMPFFILTNQRKTNVLRAKRGMIPAGETVPSDSA